MNWKSLIDENGHAVIPNSMMVIGNSAFTDCTGLTSIEIPNSVTEIGYNAFSGCTGLTSISTHTQKENPEEAAEAINRILRYFCDDIVTLYVPVGTGYAYRNFPFERRLKEVIIEK